MYNHIFGQIAQPYKQGQQTFLNLNHFFRVRLFPYIRYIVQTTEPKDRVVSTTTGLTNSSCHIDRDY